MPLRSPAVDYRMPSRARAIRRGDKDLRGFDGAGLKHLAQSRLATAAVLPNTPTMRIGASGVGATLDLGHQHHA